MVLLLINPYLFVWIKGMITSCNLLANSLVISFMELLSKEIGLKSEIGGKKKLDLRGDDGPGFFP